MAKYSNDVVYNIKTTLDASGVTKLKNELTALGQRIKAMEGNNTFGKSLGPGEVEKYTKAIRNLKTAMIDCFDQSTGMLNLKKFNGYLTSNRTEMLALNRAVQLTGAQGMSTFNSMVTAVTKLTPAATKANSVLSKMATTMGNTVRWGITSSLFQEMMSSISSSVRYMKDLDESLTQIQMVSQASAQNMRELAQYANKAAQGLATTTVDYTNAIKVFTQEGFSLPESKLQSELAIKLANVSEQGTATTADQITAYRNAFGLSIDEMSQSLDKLANVANNTAANVGELMTAAQRSASVASAVGASEDTFLASVATIQSVTRQSAEEIGNGMKTIMQRFADIKTSGKTDDGIAEGEYAQALDSIGVKVRDAQGEFRGFDAILNDLQDTWKGLSETQKVAVGEKVAGKFQYNRFAALMNNQEYYDKALGATQNAGGMMDAMQEEYASSIEGRMKTLRAAGEQLISTLFDQDAVEPILGDITALVNQLNSMVDAAGGLVPIMTAISGLMLKAFGSQISSGILNIGQNIKTFFLARSNIKDMQTTLSEMGVIGSGLDSKTYGAALLGVRQMSGASLDTRNAWQKSIEDMSQAESKKAFAEERRNKAQDNMNNALFGNMSYEQTMAQLEEERKVARITVERTQELIDAKQAELEQMRQQAEVAAQAEKDAQDQYEKGNKSGNKRGVANVLKNKTEANILAQEQVKTAENEHQNSINENEIAKQSAAHIEAQIKGLQAVNETYSTTESLLDNQIERLKTLTSQSREQLDVEGQLKDIVRDQTESLRKRLKLETEGMSKKDQNSYINNETNNFKRKATAIAKEMAEATKDAFIAADEAAMAAASEEATRKQGEKETKAKAITGVVGGIASVSFGVQQIDSIRSTLSDENLSAAEKLQQSFMSLAMSFPMVTSGLKDIRNNIEMFVMSSESAVLAEKKEIETAKEFTRLNEEANNKAEALKKAEENRAKIQEEYEKGSASQEAVDQAVAAAEKQKEAATNAATKASDAGKAASEAHTAAEEARANALKKSKLAMLGVAAAMAVITIGMERYAAYAEANAKTMERQAKNAEEAVTSYQNVSKAADSYLTLYKTYQKTGVITDELSKSSKNLKDTLEQAGLSALNSAGNYDQMANAAKKAVKEARQASIQALENQKNGQLKKSLSGEEFGNGSAYTDLKIALNDTKQFDKYEADESGTGTMGAMVGHSEEELEKVGITAKSSISDVLHGVNQLKEGYEKELSEAKKLNNPSKQKAAQAKIDAIEK